MVLGESRELWGCWLFRRVYMHKEIGPTRARRLSGGRHVSDDEASAVYPGFRAGARSGKTATPALPANESTHSPCSPRQGRMKKQEPHRRHRASAPPHWSTLEGPLGVGPGITAWPAPGRSGTESIASPCWQHNIICCQLPEPVDRNRRPTGACKLEV